MPLFHFLDLWHFHAEKCNALSCGSTDRESKELICCSNEKLESKVGLNKKY